jgi:hypothetical protein
MKQKTKNEIGSMLIHMKSFDLLFKKVNVYFIAL